MKDFYNHYKTIKNGILEDIYTIRNIKQHRGQHIHR